MRFIEVGKVLSLQRGRSPILGRFVKELLLLLLSTTLVALLFSFIQRSPLQYNLIYLLSIGLAIFLIAWGVALVRRDYRKASVNLIIATPLGSIIGVIVGSYLSGSSPQQLLIEESQVLLAAAVSAILLGGAIAYYFYVRSRIVEDNRRLHEESLNRARNEQHAAESELRLLQAQIEPHFLFNTLSNIHGLIDHNPATAKNMLENLTRYLRASLHRSRDESSTLGQEAALLQAYLAIQAIRMGERLRYVVSIPAELQGIALPPLLIQPLVENAVRHGIEPKLEGGTLTVLARRKEERLLVAVIDTGQGLQAGSSVGVGLKNVRQRMRALYGEEGGFRLKHNAPSGVRVILSLPIAAGRNGLRKSLRRPDPGGCC